MAPQASQSKVQELYRIAHENLSGGPPSQDAAAKIAQALSTLPYNVMLSSSFGASPIIVTGCS